MKKLKHSSKILLSWDSLWFLKMETSIKKKKILVWLYHRSVRLMSNMLSCCWYLPNSKLEVSNFGCGMGVLFVLFCFVLAFPRSLCYVSQKQACCYFPLLFKDPLTLLSLLLLSSSPPFSFSPFLHWFSCCCLPIAWTLPSSLLKRSYQSIFFLDFILFT